jgi:hypothetical protein
MGLEWREVRILAPKATVPRTGFFTLEDIYLGGVYSILYNIVLVLYSIFSSLHVKIEPRNYEYVFILGPVNKAANKAVKIIIIQTNPRADEQILNTLYETFT